MLFHEVPTLARLIAESGEAVPAAHDTGPVMAALIGGVVAIAVALITGYFGTRGERTQRRAPDAGHAHTGRELAEAQLDAAYAENERRDEQERAEKAEARVDVLERALVLRGFAPWRFLTGEEPDAQTRIAAGS